MSDYIEREDAMKAIGNFLSKEDDYFVDMAKGTIKLIQSADVAPVRHGRWVVIDAEEPRRYGCSECKRLSWNMENYCPNCGARMDEEANDGQDDSDR